MVKNPPANARDMGSSPGQEDPLEKEMATNSTILSWKSHGQRSLMGYNPWGRKRVGHDLATNNTKSGKLLYNTGSSTWCSVTT